MIDRCQGRSLIDWFPPFSFISFDTQSPRLVNAGFVQTSIKAKGHGMDYRLRPRYLVTWYQDRPHHATVDLSPTLSILDTPQGERILLDIMWKVRELQVLSAFSATKFYLQ